MPIQIDIAPAVRVYIRFKDSMMSNVLPASEARKLANMISLRETNEDILNLGIMMKQMATQVERLNELWSKAGAPDLPLDIQNEKTRAVN